MEYRRHPNNAEGMANSVDPNQTDRRYLYLTVVKYF